MLSFDITDRHIRIIRGTESRGRIRVSSASTIDLSEGLIVNGHIKDPQGKDQCTAPYNGNKPDAAHNGYRRGIFNLLFHCR